MQLLKKLSPLLIIFLVAFLLRAPLLSAVPDSPYWDEAILGYDAYSFAETGKDHHGVPWPIVALESFGDWKPAGYVYAAVPFVKVFGLSLLTLRLPSLLAGLALILVGGLFARKLAIPGWVGALVIAVSPWAIHFSRAAWESHLATAYIAWAMYCAIMAIRRNSLHLAYTLSSIVLFVLAWYTYHAARLVVPLLAVAVVVYGVVMIRRFASEHSHKKVLVMRYLRASVLTLALSGVLLLVSLLPLYQARQSTAMTQRFSETSIFNDLGVISRSNYAKQLADYSLPSRFIYHRYLLWSKALATAYLENVSPAFLFLNGETNIRHTTFFTGVFYPFEILFFVAGVYVWVRKREPLHWLLGFWLLVALIPSSLSVPTPHALRILAALPVFSLLIAQGLHTFMVKLQPRFGRTIVVAAVVCLYALSASIFWYNYTHVYANVAARFWQDGYAQMLATLQVAENNQPTLPVYISRTEGRPSAFLWFFRQTDPRQVQALNQTEEKDQGEYLKFDKYHFVRSPGEIPAVPALVVLTPAEFYEYQNTHQIALLFVIYAQNGDAVWIVGQQ